MKISLKGPVQTAYWLASTQHVSPMSAQTSHEQPLTLVYVELLPLLLFRKKQETDYPKSKQFHVSRGRVSGNVLGAAVAVRCSCCGKTCSNSLAPSVADEILGSFGTRKYCSQRRWLSPLQAHATF